MKRIVEVDRAGVEPMIRRKIFDPFLPTKEARRRRGLAAARRIERGHPAARRVASTPSASSRFALALPAAQTAGDDDAAKDPRPGDAGSSETGADDAGTGQQPTGGTVLLVDDDPLVRSVAERLLERLGFDVITAADGREAIRLVRERPQDLLFVMLDFAMPELDGGEALPVIRSIREDLPVLMVSGYDEFETRQRLSSLRRVEFLNKPFNCSQLRDKIESPFRS